MNKQKLGLLLGLVGGIGLVLAAMSAMMVGPAVAGPAPAPTPISVPAGGGDWVMATWHNTQIMTDASTSYNGLSFQLAAYNVADISYTSDVTGTDFQTATCWLQFSNDNTNFDQLGVRILLDVALDDTAITQTNLFGRYGRITCTVETSNHLTLTIMGKLHN